MGGNVSKEPHFWEHDVQTKISPTKGGGGNFSNSYRNSVGGIGHQGIGPTNFPANTKVAVMNTLNFASNVIESLAWPVAAIVLVVLLRNDIAKLAPFIKRLKAGPVEAEFEREVRALRESTPAPPKLAIAPPKDTASKNFLFQLAELHPRSAILESWVRVEAAARALLESRAIAAAKPSYLPAARLAEPLAQQELITQDQVTLFHELRRLRNEVAHAQGFEPTFESARAYIDLASFLQGHLEGQAK